MMNELIIRSDAIVAELCDGGCLAKLSSVLIRYIFYYLCKLTQTTNAKIVENLNP